MSGETPRSEAWRVWGLLAGVVLSLLPMLVRMQCPLDLQPLWDGDPLSQEVIRLGIDPQLSLIGDIVSLIGAGLLLWLAPGRKLNAGSVLGVLLAVGGAAACWWHMDRFGAKEAVSGGVWVSGVMVALGLWHAGKGESGRAVRVLAFALIIGAVGLLVVKGAYQVLIEHPATVEAFKRDRAGIIARNGWTADSSMAKAYERRLMQNEATGWFGFANVYASFAAMGVAAFGALSIGAWRSRREMIESGEEPGNGPLALCAAGFALSLAGLVMAGAKGGYAAAAAGLVTGGLLTRLSRSRGKGAGFAWIIGPGLVFGALAAVVARGVIGERLGELSILFRWFYMQGAARVFSEHWLHGVGPDGFQAAYALAKNPLSPEDVTSPHSLLWDWAACLGVGGLAWGAWLLMTSVRMGSATLASIEAEKKIHEAARTTAEFLPTFGAVSPRVLMRVVCLTAALSAMLAIPTQYAALLPEEAFLVRIGGVIVWCVLGCGVVAVCSRCSGWPVALAAGACVLLAHTQIEITGVWIQSSGLLLAMIALAASSCRGRHTGAVSRLPAWVGVAACIVLAMCSLGMFREAGQNQSRLSEAYRLVSTVRVMRAELERASRERPADAAVLAARLQQEEPRALMAAIRVLPRQWPSSRNASTLAMQLSDQYRRFGNSGDAPARATVWAVASVQLAAESDCEETLALLEGAAVSQSAAAGVLGRLAALKFDELDSLHAAWGGTLCSAAGDGGTGPDAKAWRELGVRFLLRARGRDPYNPQHAQRLMELYEKLGLVSEASKAAQDLLRIDDLQRLDRSVRGLSERDRAKAERLASGGVAKP